jgi:IMP cyclohydrolase
MEIAKLEELAQNNMVTHFKDNPCRGIVLGQSEDGALVQISWIMGRSPNSQNRIYTLGNDDQNSGILQILKTEPADDSKVEDPRLIIYNAMRGGFIGSGVGPQIVSNGNQTDTVFESFANNEKGEFPKVFFDSLATRYCEPDPSTFTARITGYQSPEDDAYLSVLKAEPFAREYWIKKAEESGLKPADFKSRDAYLDEIDKRAGLDRNKFPTVRDCFARSIKPGFGYCLTTYMPGSKELPPFQGEPVLVPIRGTIEETMQSFWNALEPEWRVALAGKTFTKDNMKYAQPINRFEKVISTETSETKH